jgi:membrane-associated phospholipid phosphatase
VLDPLTSRPIFTLARRAHQLPFRASPGPQAGCAVRAAAALVVAALGFAAPTHADVVTDWNALALQAVRTTGAAPPPTARNLAMLHTAMYNAVAGVNGSSLYGGFAPATQQALAQAAAAQAARDVLVAAYPSQAATFNSALASQLAALPAGAQRDAGVAYGSQAAAHILSLRASDGSSAPVTYTPSSDPGRWQPTGPLSTPLFQAYATTTPWGMTTCDQFRPAAPPSLASPEYAQALQQVRTLGSATSSVRTAEQTQIANLWAAGGGTVTPPGMWNQIAQHTISARPQIDLLQSARAFALLNMALADAAVCAWDAKAHYDFWRPVTALQGIEPGWQPLLTTPQFQSYTSGHSTFSAAGAAVLAGFFGTDNIPFSVTNDNGTVVRWFNSFSGAAAEAGMSRIYGGIHFNVDDFAGRASGGALGSYVYGNYLVPAPGAAAALLLAGGLLARRRR